MRVFITDTAGFLESYLAERFLTQGHHQCNLILFEILDLKE